MGKNRVFQKLFFAQRRKNGTCTVQGLTVLAHYLKLMHIISYDANDSSLRWKIGNESCMESSFNYDASFLLASLNCRLPHHHLQAASNCYSSDHVEVQQFHLDYLFQRRRWARLQSDADCQATTKIGIQFTSCCYPAPAWRQSKLPWGSHVHR